MNYNITSVVNDRRSITPNIVIPINIGTNDSKTDTTTLRQYTQADVVVANTGVIENSITNTAAICEDTTACKVLTLEDVRSQLNEYVMIPKEYYERIPIGSVVRYITTDDMYHSGGYIKKMRHIEQSLEICFENKRTGPARGRTIWWVKASQIKLLFKQTHSNMSIEIQLIRRDLAKKTQDLDEIRNELIQESNKRFELENKFDFIVEQIKKHRLLIKELQNVRT